MKWFRRTLRDPQSDESAEALRGIRDKFTTFYTVLERNNHALKGMSDMEAMARSGCPVETSEIRYTVDRIRRGVRDMVRNLIVLGGDTYKPLDERLREINREINKKMPGRRPIEEDAFTVPFEALTREDVWRVGCKNAHLGEMKSRLGLPVPDGFAVTAWAYKVFMDANSLQERVTSYIHGVDIGSFEDLARAAEGIQDMVLSSPVPDPVAAAIGEALDRLRERNPDARLAVRSSAIGEDTFYSFAGQYATFLNVRPEDVLDRYREVLASKFSAKAIYYFLSHSMSEADLAMSAGVMAMCDATASGVLYTRDPVRPRDGRLLVNATPGLGMPLMDGEAPPDVFKVSRDSKRCEIECIADKREMLVARGGELSIEPVPRAARNAPCISEEQLCRLAAHAMAVEAHYGAPQDLEWAVDAQGRIAILQTRPLRIMEESAPLDPDLVRGAQVLLDGGSVICPGAGAGPVFHAISNADLPAIPDRAVLVAPQPFPALVTALNKISALIIAEPGMASHTATLAREHATPTICGLDKALALPAGQTVTVDATAGRVYDGLLDRLIKTRQTQCSFCSEDASRELLLDLMAHITPLNLLHPSDENFQPAACQTLHDITRYAHQKAIDEMFTGARELRHKERISLRLKSDIPLEMNVIYIDQDLSGFPARDIPETDIASAPMAAFWEGLRSERWPVHLSDTQPRGLATSSTHRGGSSFSQTSFAVLGAEFMMVSLRMGYHFSTIEAMCAPQPDKNFIRMQLKQGGATPDRRARRVRLLTSILTAMGFNDNSKGDFLDVETSYHGPDAIKHKLRLIGRLTVMTKQLDMALSNEAITDWYISDFLKKLGLAGC